MLSMFLFYKLEEGIFLSQNASDKPAAFIVHAVF